jgi:hypothetical protein
MKLSVRAAVCNWIGAFLCPRHQFGETPLSADTQWYHSLFSNIHQAISRKQRSFLSQSSFLLPNFPLLLKAANKGSANTKLSFLRRFPESVTCHAINADAVAVFSLKEPARA